MKILIISTPFIPCPPPTYGGLELITYNLGVALSKRGHEVAIACPTESKLPDTIKHIDIGRVKYTVHQDWLNAEENAYKIWKEHAKDYDIIHGHNWFGHEYLYKVDNPKVKVIHTHHGHINWQSPPPVQYPNLCAISDFMAKEYSKKLGVNVRRVYNGIDLDLYPYSEEYGDRLLFVGRFTSFKGVHVAIDAAKRLRMPIDVVGGSMFVEDQSYAQRIIDQHDGKMVRVFPDAPHQIKLKLLQTCKALLMPSMMSEPFGLTAVEAMACGKAVVALDDGALKEVVEHGVTGFVVKNPDEMVEVIKSGEIDKIDPKACRKRVEELFTKEKMALEYEKLFKDILDGREW
jgi:glycosyltransferase involved in cell wall biosynthesis